MTRSIMFQGTGSNVGKSVLVAGFCRALLRRGLTVAPFKPQNMSNNAAVALGLDGDGGEIGRAQWLQALACRRDAHVDMNPVLLKPQSESGAQIVVQGKVYGQASAREYQQLRQGLMPRVLESFNRLKAQVDFVVVEGAGSPAEINLREGDIANMGFALEGDVPVVLLGDIDRGGVIASLVGTHTVLDEQDRQQICGFMVNKFRGDISLFDEGRASIGKFTRWRDFGVLPWMKDAKQLPEEDSVWFDQKRSISGGKITIAVPVTSRIANFDDFNPLACESDVNLVFVKSGESVPKDTNLVVLAGSKSTIGDLQMLREQGWGSEIIEHAKRGGEVIGICGGYQMLGKEVHDPHGIEGEKGSMEGLGLLDVVTHLEPRKTVRVSSGQCVQTGAKLEGYEIHLGCTEGKDCEQPMLKFGSIYDGAVNPEGNVRGCYLHGLFANDTWRKLLINRLGGVADEIGYSMRIDKALDAVADTMEAHLDVDGLLEIAS